MSLTTKSGGDGCVCGGGGGEGGGHELSLSMLASVRLEKRLELERQIWTRLLG